jgi:hypothetical protein
MQLFYLLTGAAIALLQVSAHMLMSWPLPRGYTGNPHYTPVDYDLLNPLPRPVSSMTLMLTWEFRCFARARSQGL